MKNKNTIILNGLISTQIPGLLIQELPAISKPAIRTQVEEIDGRDGDIVTALGYSAYTKEITIGLYGDFDINQVIAYFNGEGSVIFSNEPDKYYYYQIIEQIDFERLVRYRTATVTFHVQPFKYAANESDYILDPPAQNLLNIPNFTRTTNGITLTVQEGTINVTGTGTAATEFYVPTGGLSLAAGSYTLTATAVGRGATSASVRLIKSAPSNVDTFGGNYITLKNAAVSISGTVAATTTYNYLWFYINPNVELNFTLTTTLEDEAEKVASGEGSSLALINTTEAPFNRFDIKGDTYQQTYSGANLYNYTDTQSVSTSGVTVDDEGWITMTKDNISGGSTIYVNYFSKPMQLAPNTDYAIILEVKSAGTSTGANSEYLSLITGNALDQWGSTLNYALNTLQANSVYVAVRRTKSDLSSATIGLRTFLAVSAGVSNSITFRVSVLADTSVTPETFVYQPYTGGNPAPNPDYPQEVQVVKHQDMIRLTGKNLVNVNELYLNPDIERTSDGLRKTIVANALTTYYAGSVTNPAGIYTVSFDARITNPDEATLVLNTTADIWDGTNLPIKDKNGNAADLDYRTLEADWKRYNFTVIAYTSDVWTSERAAKLYFATYTNSPIFELRNFQIELGANATEFDVSRTQMYPINFRTGKNMLSVDFLGMGDMLYGTPVTSILYRVNNALAPMKVKPSTTYTISATLGSTVRGMRVSVCECDANTLYLQDNGWQQLTSGAYSFTTRSDTEYIKLVLSLSTTNATVTEGTTENTTEFNTASEWLRGAKIQVEENTAATSYEDYQSMELCKVGNYQDYITKSGDDWYVHKATEKMVLDGTTNAMTGVYGNGITQDYNFCTKLMNDMKPGAQVGYCSYLTSSTGSPYGANRETIFFGTQSNNYIYMGVLSSRTGGLRTLTAFNTYLETHPATLYYPLATPTDTKITNEETIAQLDALKNNVHAYKEMTFISSLPANASGLPPIIGAEVIKSSDGVVTNSGNFPAKPKLTIYGTGDIGVSLNGNQIFQIALGDEGYITIDTAAMEAYQDSIENLKNRLVTGDYDNFLLNPGDNTITFSGVVKQCIVENYSRWL